MPRCGGCASGSVLTRVATTVECAPLVAHIFVPLMTYSPPSSTARVWIACTSEPQLGSLIENPPWNSPVAMRGRKRWRCSSVPNFSIRKLTMKWVLMMPVIDIQPRAISSQTIA